MSGDYKYLRVTVDITVFDNDEFAKKLARAKHNGNEPLGRELAQNISAGVVEIDDVFDAESHGGREGYA